MTAVAVPRLFGGFSRQRTRHGGFAVRFHDLTYAMVVAGLIPLFTSNVLTPLWTVPAVAVLVLAFGMDTGRIPRLQNRVFWIVTTALVVTYVALHVFDQDMRFTAFLRLILYLQAFRLLNPKRNREYVQVHLLAFFQVLVTTAFNPSFSIAIGLVFFMVTSTWALMALTVKRGLESQASFARAGREDTLRIGLATEADQLVRPRYLAATAAIALGTFIVTFPIFYAIPRIGTGLFLSPLGQPRLITGFNDEVKLGQVGELELRGDLAMRVEFQDPTQLGLLGQPRHIRGIALNQYDASGRWRSTLNKHSIPPRNQNPLATRDFRVGRGPGRRPVVAYTIYQEPIGTTAIFGFPVPFQVLINSENLRVDGAQSTEGAQSMALPRLPGATIAYTVQSYIEQLDLELLRAEPARYDSDIRVNYLGVPPDLDPRVGDLAREITASATNPYDQAVAIRDHLERNFTYTLELVRDQRLGPLEDFLFVQKRGHCEYFATAQAMMLRILGVPTRLVNGFLQGEANPFGEYLIVRESDAHSWVEVYFNKGGWVTFDPSPRSIARDDAQDTAGESAVHMLDAIRLAWSRYVLAFTAADQRHAFERMVQVYSTTRWLRNPNPLKWLKRELRSEEGSSWKRFAGGVVILAALAYAGWNLIQSPRGRWRRRRKQGDVGADLALASGLYREMVTRLARRGIPKDPAATPREFRDEVKRLEDETVPAVVRITALFERVRYAGDRLEDRDLDAAEADLKTVARARRPKRGARRSAGSPPAQSPAAPDRPTAPPSR